jgi:hypothetical protein
MKLQSPPSERQGADVPTASAVERAAEPVGDSSPSMLWQHLQASLPLTTLSMVTW